MLRYQRAPLLRQRRSLCGFFILCLLCLPAIAQPDDLRHKRVLLLYSYHPAFPTSDKILSGLQQAFGDQQPQLDIEYMDSKRHNDSISIENFRQLLQHKLALRPAYDLVISADDNALSFLRKHRAALIGQTPVVFLGVNNHRLAQQSSALPWITGVIEGHSFVDNLNLIRQLMPERQRLHVISDSRPSTRADREALQALQADFPALTILDLSLEQLSWKELQQQLLQLGEQDIILLLGAYSDRMGQHWSFSESLSWIYQASEVPIIHPYEHGFGNGILGGIVVSHTEQGRQAGRIAREILTGQAIRNIASVDKSPNLPMVDHAELKRFGIERAQLPDNTVIVNQPILIWHHYQTEIITASLIISVLLLLAVYLASQNIRMQRLSEKVEEKNSYLRLLMETQPDLVWIKDPEGIYLACNKRFEHFIGAPEREILGKTDYLLLDQQLADFFRQHDRAAMQARKPLVNEEEITFANDGHTELLETIKTPIFDSKSGRILGVFGVGRDITQRKANENMLRLTASVVESTIEAIMLINADGRIIQVNGSFSEITGYSRDEVIGKKPDFLRSDGYDHDFYQQVEQTLRDHDRWSGEYINRNKDGSLCPVWQTISTVRDDQGEIRNYVSVFSDISEIKQSQQEVFHLAYHDTLTNLPNRLLLTERINQAIKHAHRKQRTFTLMFVDLDNFKNINDTQGHNEGDLLLQNIATLLRHTLREKDTVARIGGDEFILLFDDVAELQEAEKLAAKVLSVLSTPIELSESSASISASIGICQFPHDGDSADELLKNADTAMYRAKQQGRNNFQFYNAELTRHVVERVELEKALRNALQKNEFCLHYQPQIDLNSGQVIGAEALLRWHSDQLGNVSPDRFIPVAEESGLILALGHWVVNEACRQIRQWKNQQLNIGKVAVNISGAQISKTDLAGEVSSLMAEYQLSPSDLSLEVTETFVMQHQSTAVSQLSILHGMNLELAIDDFGTGYSSLSYLKKLPINKLKIDKSFIQDIPHDPDDMAIARTIIALADSLGLTVIAEGVETEEQAAYLKATGCHQAQGYLYGKPMPAEQLQDFIKQYQKGH